MHSSGMIPGQPGGPSARGLVAVTACRRLSRSKPPAPGLQRAGPGRADRRAEGSPVRWRERAVRLFVCVFISELKRCCWNGVHPRLWTLPAPNSDGRTGTRVTRLLLHCISLVWSEVLPLALNGLGTRFLNGLGTRFQSREAAAYHDQFTNGHCRQRSAVARIYENRLRVIVLALT